MPRHDRGNLTRDQMVKDSSSAVLLVVVVVVVGMVVVVEGWAFGDAPRCSPQHLHHATQRAWGGRLAWAVLVQMLLLLLVAVVVVRVAAVGVLLAAVAQHWGVGHGQRLG